MQMRLWNVHKRKGDRVIQDLNKCENKLSCAQHEIWDSFHSALYTKRYEEYYENIKIWCICSCRNTMIFTLIYVPYFIKVNFFQTPSFFFQLLYSQLLSTNQFLLSRGSFNTYSIHSVSTWIKGALRARVIRIRVEKLRIESLKLYFTSYGILNSLPVSPSPYSAMESVSDSGCLPSWWEEDAKDARPPADLVSSGCEYSWNPPSSG